MGIVALNGRPRLPDVVPGRAGNACPAECERESGPRCLAGLDSI